jgi:hypothetical protein
MAGRHLNSRIIIGTVNVPRKGKEPKGWKNINGSGNSIDYNIPLNPFLKRGIFEREFNNEWESFIVNRSVKSSIILWCLLKLQLSLRL